MSYQKQKH